MCGRSSFQFSSTNASYNHCPTQSQPIIVSIPSIFSGRSCPSTTDAELSILHLLQQQQQQQSSSSSTESISKQAIGQEISPKKTNKQVVDVTWGIQMPHTVINCREDTESKTFQSLLNTHRCVVPVTGWYEWDRSKAAGAQPRPYYFFKKPELIKPPPADDVKVEQHDFLLSQKQLYFAGIRARDGHHYVTLTTDASPSITHIHHRMPVILDTLEIKEWLDHSLTYDEVRHLVKSKESVAFHAVARNVNDVRYNDPSCVEPVAIKKQSTLNFTPPAKRVIPSSLLGSSSKTPLVNVKLQDLSEKDQIERAIQLSSQDIAAGSPLKEKSRKVSQDNDLQETPPKMKRKRSSSSSEYQDAQEVKVKKTKAKSTPRKNTTSTPAKKSSASSKTPQTEKNQKSIKSFFSPISLQ